MTFPVISKQIIRILYILSVFQFSSAQSYHRDNDEFQTLSFLEKLEKNLLQSRKYINFGWLWNNLPFHHHSNDFISDVLNSSETSIDNRTFINSAVSKARHGKYDMGRNVSCAYDLFQIFHNPAAPSSLKMLDSSGKIASGILRGNVIWPGHYSECLNVYLPPDGEGHGGYHGQYCVSSWTLNLTSKYKNAPLSVGLCIPDSCSAEFITTAFNEADISDLVLSLTKFKVHFKFNTVVCKVKNEPLDTPAIIYLSIVSVCVLLAVIGSLLTAFNYLRLNQQTRKGSSSTIQIQNYNNSNFHKDVGNQLSPTFENNPSNGTCVTPNNGLFTTEQSVPVMKRIFLCFSIFLNGQKILNVKNIEGQLLSIHGLKFISLSWIVLGHTFANSASVIGNTIDVLEAMDNFAFQIIFQATLSVDTFFMISGFLLTYIFLKYADQVNGKINWLQFYLHRIWRLTPSYLILVFFYILIFKHIGSGPFWEENKCEAQRNTWWKYILYINNFIPIRDMCVGWIWYLGNDMQFYVISPLFLYPLWRWPAVGFTILGIILCLTWATTGVISFLYDLIPMGAGITQADDLLAYENKMWDTFDLIYDKPYCRIAPYIIGAILGYILHKTGDKRNFLTWWQQLLGWIIALFCSLSVTFGLYHVHSGWIISLFYNIFARTSFSIGVAWLLYACETGHGGFIGKLLSWKAFIPLSRLTYSAYLVHPVLTHGYYQAFPVIAYYTAYVAAIHFMGFLITSFILAFFFSILFESPFINLEKLMFKR